MIHSTVRMVLPSDRLTEALGILNPLAERTRAERGCLGCHVYRDAKDRTTVTVTSMWANEAELERHLRSQDYQQLLLVMELSKVPPEVRFDRVLGSTGMETIEEARE